MAKREDNPALWIVVLVLVGVLGSGFGAVLAFTSDEGAATAIGWVVLVASGAALHVGLVAAGVAIGLVAVRR